MERVWHKDYANHLAATNDIADCIVGFYNAVRLHSKLGNLSLTAFEHESTSEKPIKLSKITKSLQLLKPSLATKNASASADRQLTVATFRICPARAALHRAQPGDGPARPTRAPGHTA